MNGKIMAGGLIVVAILAIGVAMASAEEAAEEFRSGSANNRTVVTGANHEKIEDTIRVGEKDELTCKTSSFEGTSGENPAPAITIVAKYSECKFLEEPAFVKMNHCAYILRAETVETPGTGIKHGPVEIECATGNKIEIEIEEVCTISIGKQTPKDGIVYTNVEPAGKKELTTHLTLKEIVYAKTGPKCNLIGGNGKDGEYTATWTLKGYEDTGSALVGTERTTPAGKTTHTVGQVNIRKE
jgi:hypothetical protein